MRRFVCDCAARAQWLKAGALAEGLGAGSEVVEDLQGSLVCGEYDSGRHSFKSRAEMFAGFCLAILVQ
jgi:hypothetical protein